MILRGFSVSVVLLVGFGMVSAQDLTRPTNESILPVNIPATGPHPLKGIVTSIPVHELRVSGDRNKTALMFPSLVTTNPIPLWTYNVTAYDSGQYSGTIIGTSPYNHGKTTTTIPTQIVPLVITIRDSTGTVVYDPPVADPVRARAQRNRHN